MKIKKMITGILMLFITSHLSGAGEMKSRNELFIERIFLSIEELMNKHYKKSTLVTERYLYIIDKLEKNELKITISKDYPKSIYGGMAFVYYVEDNSTPYICISDYFIELYESHPSLVMCILLHEFDHAFNYFNHEENFRKSQKDELENFLYEMDALFTQTLFLRDIIPSSEFKLTKYEQFLLTSLKEDNLRSVSGIFQTVDMQLVYDLVRIIPDKTGRNEKIKKIQDISTNLVSTHPDIEKSENHQKYCTLVTLLSFINYAPYILFRIEDNDYRAKKKTGQFSMNNFPEISKNINKMTVLVKPHLEFINQYQTEWRKTFEKF